MSAVTRLFEDYLARRPGVLSFYAGDWGEVGAWQAAAERALAYEGPRAETARILLERNAGWITEKARDRIEAVASGKGVAVVGGQQAGLLTGPLYTIHKAITLLRLASRVEEELGIPVLPLFWAATNDGDLEEAGALTIIDGEHRLQRFNLAHLPEMAPYRGWPVGRIPLGDCAGRIGSFVGAHLAGTGFVPELLDTVKATYTAGHTVGEAFVALMGRWLGPLGLVLLDPTWPEFREATAGLFRKVLSDPLAAVRCLEESEEALRAAGYRRQLHMPPNRLPLFATARSEPRRPLIPAGNGGEGPVVEVEGAGRVEMEALLDPDGPWEVDPHAALRPVLQDYLLPTALFVGGAAEIAYFGQLGPLYEHFGVPRPVAMPRARAVLLPRVAARILEKYELTSGALTGGPEAAVKKIAGRLLPDDLEEAFGAAGEAIAGRLEHLKRQAIRFDTNLEKPFDTSAGRMESELRKLKEKAIRSRSRREEILLAQLAKAATWLHPEGAPQERVLNIVPFLARHGAAALFPRLLERLDPSNPAVVQEIAL